MKLVIEEPESAALERHLDDPAVIATSAIAMIEVRRAVALANPSEQAHSEADRLLRSCMLVSVTAQLLRRASALTSASVRTLDAIHLASALRVDPDELLAYDRRLIAAAREEGLEVVSPGA